LCPLCQSRQTLATQETHLYSKLSRRVYGYSFGLNAGLTIQFLQLDFSGSHQSGLFPRRNQLIHTTPQYGLPHSLLLGVSATFRSSFDFRLGQFYSDPVVFHTALTWELGSTDHVRLEYTCGYFQNWGIKASAFANDAINDLADWFAGLMGGTHA